jgi:hypothetical protein
LACGLNTSRSIDIKGVLLMMVRKVSASMVIL